MSKRRKRVYWVLAGLLVLAGIAAAVAGPLLSRVEQPDYKVASSNGPIEVRSYGPMIAAQATVKGNREDSINEGFRLIAGYIFGANKPNAEIEMTAPVQQQRDVKIAMTAPVTQQGGDDSWTVQFIMPKKWTMETLPVPDDDRVTLIPVKPRKMLAITFSGTANDAMIAKKTAELKAYATAQKLALVGEPMYAFYNPPWTLPFLRRNEVMFELVGNQSS